MLQSQNKFGNVEPRAFFTKAGLTLEVPEEFAATFEISDEVEIGVCLEAKLESDQEGRFEGSLEDFAFSDGMGDLLLCHDFLFGQDLHGVYPLCIFLADLEDLAKSAAANELEKFEIAWSEGTLGLEGRKRKMKVRTNEKAGCVRTLYCSYVIWTRISPLTASSS